MKVKDEQIKALNYYLQVTESDCASRDIIQDILLKLMDGKPKFHTEEQTHRNFLTWLAKQPELSQKRIVGADAFHEYKTNRYIPPSCWIDKKDYWINIKTKKEVSPDNAGIRKQPEKYQRRMKGLLVKFDQDLIALV